MMTMTRVGLPGLAATVLLLLFTTTGSWYDDQSITTSSSTLFVYGFSGIVGFPPKKRSVVVDTQYSSSSPPSKQSQSPLVTSTTITTRSITTTSSSSLRSSIGQDEGTTSTTTKTTLQVSLEKPLGMILEEIEENQPKGVFVKELADGGSAFGQDQLIGLTLSKVNGIDMTTQPFDTVMETLISSPSPVELEFIMSGASSDDDDDDDDDDSSEVTTDYAVGTDVTIKVVSDNDGEDVVASIPAKVGDNLRQVLLENNVEVYKGLKQKLGNCGGGGQCGFCAADFVETDGWVERSDYEAKKLSKQPSTARLTCLNNIQGPATVRIL